MHIKSLKKLTGIFLFFIVLGLSTASAQQYEIKAFETVGEHSWDVPDNVDKVDVLVVAGGGGGGATRGGGGGAGGVIYRQVDVSQNNSVSISVGKGGSGGTNPGDGSCGYGARNNAENGGESSFGFVSAQGGGGGAPHGCDGKDGASGGGGGTDYGAGGASTINGYSGGNADVNCGRSGLAAGGGGAGETGLDSECSDGYIQQPGDGGDGLYYGDIFGDEYGENGWFSGGGGGGHEGRTDISGEVRAAYGGQGGGGNSAAPSDGQSSSADGHNAMKNTGGGGGGGNYEFGSGGDGGSGIVLIRYEGDFIICDRRGLFNECISNSTHSISGQSFNISSIFHSEASSVFEALDSKATLNVSNSTEISGVWTGSFDILSGVEGSRLKAGASFRPGNGRILIN